MVVMPNLRSRRRDRTKGEKRRGVKPPPWRAGQKRLPGRPKWRPVAAVEGPGVMPAKRAVGVLAGGSGASLVCGARGWGLVGFRGVGDVRFLVVRARRA